MTASLRKQIAEATELLDALRIIQADPQASGAIKILSDGSIGELSFNSGRLVGASISPSGETGQAALEKIIAIRAQKLQYAKFRDKLLPADHRIDVPLESFIKQVLGNHETINARDAGTTMPPDEQKIEFDAVEGKLHSDEETLKDARRALLQQAVKRSHEAPEFSEKHPDLHSDGHEEDVAKRTGELLTQVTVDEKPFHISDKPIDWHIPSLTEQQRESLTKAEKEGRDLHSFELVNEYLHVQGIALTHDQIADLLQLSAVKSPHEQREEFHTKDERLEGDEPIALNELIAKEKEAGEDTEESTELDKAEVTDEDRVPLQLLHDKPQPKVRKPVGGLMGRLGEFTGAAMYRFPYDPRDPHKFPLELIIGAVFLGVLAIACLAVPAAIRNSAEGPDAEARARERLRKHIHEEIASEAPQEAAEMRPAGPIHRVAPPNNAAPGSIGEEIKPEATSEDLRFARVLVGKGKINAAVAYYEKYANRDQELSFDVRMELINAYLATNHRAKARLLCLNTLKMRLTNDQLAGVWQLLSQCQVD